MSNYLETEQPQQMFWVHTVGLAITLPPKLTREVTCAVVDNKPIPEIAKQQLAIITEDSILKKRFPASEDGETFMEFVNFDRRCCLLSLAKNLTNEIVLAWKRINPQKEIAVLLYGSIARGLVKNIEHPEPSDIDLTVIGSFTKEERLVLLERIHPVRESIRKEVLKSCPNVDAQKGEDIRYAGTMVQSVEKLTKNNHSGALHYIGSCATPLYDPTDIWQRIETAALRFMTDKRSTPARISSTKHHQPISTANLEPSTPLPTLIETMIATGTNQNRQLIEVLVTRSRWYST